MEEQNYIISTLTKESLFDVIKNQKLDPKNCIWLSPDKKLRKNILNNLKGIKFKKDNLIGCFSYEEYVQLTGDK